MAADNPGLNGVTDTLVASTVRKFQLTGPGNKLRITHHGGGVTNPVFFTTAASEAALVTASLTADEMRAVAPGQTRVLNVGRDTTGVWVSVISGGTAGVTVELEP
jgi:hypothetical protein